MNFVSENSAHPIHRWDAKGLAIAFGILGVWLASTVYLFQHHGELGAVIVAVAVVLRTLLYTAIFITVHDAIHGTISPQHPLLTKWIGRIGAFVYAGFWFDSLAKSHSEHHAHPGEDSDPDFHPPDRPSYWQWYLRFVRNYVRFGQIVLLAVVFNVLEHLVGIDAVALLLYWVVPSILSTFQLFTFGTFLPHRGEPQNEHHARSTKIPPWLSLVTCFHFGGYHYEHHAHPWAPWWHLPKTRDQLEK